MLKFNIYENPPKLLSGNNIFLILIFLGIPTIANLFIILPYYKEKKLLKYGTVTMAENISEYEHTVRGNQVVSLVTYYFRDNENSIKSGQKDFVPAKSRADFSEDRRKLFDNPTVIFDSTNSKNNMLYPPSMAKLL